MKNFCYRFLRSYESCKLKTGKQMDSGLMYPIYQNQGQGPISLRVTYLDTFYNSAIIEKNFVTLFSRTVRVTKLKPGKHMGSGLLNPIYQN